MNNTDKKNFYTNAAISSKSEKYPGLLFVAACADVGLLGNVTFHTSNTCKSKKIVIGDSDNRSLLQEYYDVCSHMKNKLKDKDKNLKKNKLTKTAIEKLNWFFEKLESLIKNLNNECGGLVNVIYPSGAKRMLEDLEQNVIGKMKAWALPSSGKNDEDYVDLVKDDYGMNVAKLYGAEKFRYSNGSGLVSWIQTGALFDSLLKNLNSLLDCEAENKIFINVVQTFMNVIFINNQCLPELDRIKILDNYKKFIDSIYEKKLSLVEYKDSLTIEDKKNELDRPVKFIKFLLKQLCKDTSLQNLDLDEKNNKKKYIDVICGISNSLSVAQHPNQVLVEQWILNEDQTPLVISDAFLGKNNVLYLSLYKILQRFYLLQPGKFANDDKKEFNSMLNFMINLAGKFRYKKIDLNLSDIKNEDEYKFGCQITSNGKYTVPTKYDTDISRENLMNLAIQIVEFYEFENKLKSKEHKLDDSDVENILKYLLDGRQFNNDAMRKITKNKDFMEKLIDQAKNKNIGDDECCYQTAYEILVNEYLDVMIKNKYIDIKSVSKYNLIKYFESPDKYDQIIDLDAKTIVELKLFDKLEIDMINEYLNCDNEKKRKIIEVLKLVIGRIANKKLNKLDFRRFDDELLSTVVLSRLNDLSDDTIKKINFEKLDLSAQKTLFKKMANNNFNNFDFKVHWSGINVLCWQELKVKDWCKFVFNKLLNFKDEKIFNSRQDILKLIPIGVLSLFVDENNANKFYAFLNNCSDCWSTAQILSVAYFEEKTQKLDMKENKNSLDKKIANRLLLLYSAFSTQGRQVDFTNSLFNCLSQDQECNCLKYIFGNLENHYLLAMIIMERFIFMDQDDNHYKEFVQQIKPALNWNDGTEKNIINTLLSYLPKINELMFSFYEVNGQNHYVNFDMLIDIYKSFLHKILLYSNNIEEKNMVRIPIDFLEKKEDIELLCEKCGDKIDHTYFSEMINSISGCQISSNDKNSISKALNAFKILHVDESAQKIKEKANILNTRENKDISTFMKEIESTAILICHGYRADEPGNSVQEHLKRYDDNGAIKNFDGFDSTLYAIFKNICEKKMSVQEFIDKYDYQNVNQKDLESITDDNKVDKFQQFENFILPFIEQEYNKMSFIDFDKKYGCLNSIGIENIDTLIINRAYGLIKDGLSWEDFIQKYYVETITENENKNDKNERWAIIEILINNGDAKKIINGLDSEIIHSLYENLIPKNKIIKIDNESKKTDIEMRQEIEVYCQNIIALKNTIENKSDPEAVKLAKIWFSEDDNLAREKSLKLKFIIDEYKKEIMSEDGESTENNWKGFSEMYILKHMYPERIKEYKRLEPEYEKIKDLCAKADNLNNQVQLFYRNLNGAFNRNITKLDDDYTNKNKILICGFLAKIRPNLKDYGMGIYPRLKRLLEIMHESNRYMKDTKISSVYNKYNNLFNSDDAAAEIRRFFSSMTNFVHLIKDCRTLTKIFENFNQNNGNEYIDDIKKFKLVAEDIIDIDPDEQDSFTVCFVDCLDVIKDILDKNSTGFNSDYISNLKTIYEKYKTYTKRFFVTTDLKNMQDRKFINDFERAALIIKTMGVQDSERFNKCVKLFNELLDFYEKNFKYSSSPCKFIELGVEKSYFSSEQIRSLCCTRLTDDIDLISYTPKCIIKKFPMIVDSIGKYNLKQIAQRLYLKPEDRLEYIMYNNNDLQNGKFASTMRKLFLHMSYTGYEYIIDSEYSDYNDKNHRAKKFMDVYNFESVKGQKNGEDVNIYSLAIDLKKCLLSLFGIVDVQEETNEKRKFIPKFEYKDLNLNHKFILGECFFGSLLMGFCRDYNNDFGNKYEENLCELIKILKKRILSILKKLEPLNRGNNARISFLNRCLKQLNEKAEILLNDNSIDRYLDELIACAFLSAHIYICSGHLNGVAMFHSQIELGTQVYKKIVSMLGRSIDKKFKNIEDVKNWVNETSLKYFINGTFNFNEIPENERRSDQMELEQTDLIQKYNESILDYILSKIDNNISTFDVLKKIYIDNNNEVVYKFDEEYLYKFLTDTAIPKIKIEQDFLILFKFLRRVIPITGRKEQIHIIELLFSRAKDINLLDSDNKSTTRSFFKSWAENLFIVCNDIYDNNYGDKVRNLIVKGCIDIMGKDVFVVDLFDIFAKIGKVRYLDYYYFSLDFFEAIDRNKIPFMPNKLFDDLTQDRLTSIFNFLAKINHGSWYLNNIGLLDIFHLLDAINNGKLILSKDGQTKKFKDESALNEFFDLQIFNVGNDGENSGEKNKYMMLLKLSYTLLRLPEDKTLLDLTEDLTKDLTKYIKKLPGARYNYKVYKDFVEIVKKCINGEKNGHKISKTNQSNYFSLLCLLFGEVKLSNNNVGLDFINNINSIARIICDTFALLQDPNLIFPITKFGEEFKHLAIDAKDNEKSYFIFALCLFFAKSLQYWNINDLMNLDDQFWSLLCEYISHQYFENNEIIKSTLNKKIEDSISGIENSEEKLKVARNIVDKLSKTELSKLLDFTSYNKIINEAAKKNNAENENRIKSNNDNTINQNNINQEIDYKKEKENIENKKDFIGDNLTTERIIISNLYNINQKKEESVIENRKTKDNKNRFSSKLKYLMYALSTCAALLFAYFFITGAVTNAIIALVITVTLFALSIISSIFSRDAKQGVEELKKIGTSLDRNENQNVILKNLENEPYNRDQNTIINQEIE